jgi:ParB family chromosome partitioning protein
LGKGLDALLPIDIDKLPDSVAAGGVSVILLEDIIPNANQPRKNFDPVTLEELANTIKRNGVLQPIIVEQAENGKFIIIAGERRMRAARIAGLAEIPAIIKKFSPEESFLVSILENLQRENLNPIEEAAAFKQMMEITGLNQESVAAKVGKNRATVANSLRLLKLAPEMQEAIITGAITPGHARALLSVENASKRLELFRKMISDSLSVREAEKLAGETLGADYALRKKGAEKAGGGNAERDPELISIEEQFIKVFGTKVKIEGDFSGGVIRIEYYSDEDLNRIYNVLIMKDNSGD